MKYTTVTMALAACALTLTSLSSFAQGRRQDAPQDRPQDRAQMERGPQDRDQGRLQDRDRLDVPSHDRVRDQDRTHAPKFSGLSDQDIYGSEVMSVQERNEYRKRLQSADTTAKRKRVEAQHRATVQSRAKLQNTDLAKPGRGIYGGAVMSVEERNQYREQLRLTDSDTEKEKFMAQHREEMQMRARAQGIDSADLEQTD